MFIDWSIYINISFAVYIPNMVSWGYSSSFLFGKHIHIHNENLKSALQVVTKIASGHAVSVSVNSERRVQCQ